jgi:hypothetical protein
MLCGNGVYSGALNTSDMSDRSLTDARLHDSAGIYNKTMAILNSFIDNIHLLLRRARGQDPPPIC